MPNGKAYMVVRCPVNAGNGLHLLADCYSFYADYLDHVFVQIMPNAVIDNNSSTCPRAIRTCQLHS